MTYVIFIGYYMLQKKLNFIELLLVGLIISVVLTNATLAISADTLEQETLETVEIREYEGKDLSSIDGFFENSIKGPQYIDTEDYTLTFWGLVNNELQLTYDEAVNNYRHFQKVITLYCVEGWSVTLLWEGIMVKDLIADAGVDPSATTVIFYAYDGYSTSLPLDYIIDNNIMIAYKMNNVTLPAERGYPFELVAESKWGYKWIKWIVAIELSDNADYRGYWENRGFSNDANLIQTPVDPEVPGVPPEIKIPPAIPEFPSWIIFPLFATATVLALISRKRLSQKKLH
jgi:DMSO/TMAO reductase YedYZ molybdopterin-dependent catalytic subunit